LQIKGVNSESAVGIHQDLTTVDENVYGAATLWIPLNPSKLSNGAISFLEGSHNCFRGYRAHTANNYQFQYVEQFVFKNSTPYTTELGQALVFHPGTIHYSPQNISSEPRLSIAVSIVNTEAKPQIGYLNKSELPWRMDLFSVPDDFHYHYSDFKTERYERPSFGSFIGYLDQEIVNSYDKRLFQKIYTQYILRKKSKNRDLRMSCFLDFRKLFLLGRKH
jgi:hypothetical protein